MVLDLGVNVEVFLQDVMPWIGGIWATYLVVGLLLDGILIAWGLTAKATSAAGQ